MENSYYNLIPPEIYNIVVSILDYPDFNNFIIEYGYHHLNFNEMLKLKFPDLTPKNKVTLKEYTDKLKLYHYDFNEAAIINISPGNYDYIIFRTRYIDRILSENGKDLSKLFHKKFYQHYFITLEYDGINLSHIYAAINTNGALPISPKDPKIIFTNDNGTYNKYDPVANEIIQIFDKTGPLFTKTGTICIRPTEFANSTDLENILNYAHGINNPYKIGTFNTLRGEIVLYLEYDTESG